MRKTNTESDRSHLEMAGDKFESSGEDFAVLVQGIAHQVQECIDMILR
jgi:hypothetical protein